jgi:Fe-S-cluster containining protein
MGKVHFYTGMAFVCARCGSCCRYLGDYLVIERETAPFEFACCAVSTGTEFTARIDGDKQDLFQDRSFPAAHPHACPFLRPDGEQVVCTIHETRPPQCRAYRCVILRISSPGKGEVGRVHGTFGLFSDDPDLRKAWDQVLGGVSLTAPDAEDQLQRSLEKMGYHVI